MMLSNVRILFLVVFIMSLLAGCAAPEPTTVATIELPTSTSLPPTDEMPAATATLGISGVQVSIPVGADGETVNATITGNGDIGIIMANTPEGVALAWAPLVDALDSNENLRIVTFEYRDKSSYSTIDDDVIAVHDYLRAEGIQRTICIGGGVGTPACAFLQEQPDIIGMVFISTQVSAIDSGFPKLFLTADSDPFGMAGSTQRAYEQSAEPKEFRSYTSTRHGPGLFTDPNVGSQVLADITDFINGITNGQ